MVLLLLVITILLCLSVADFPTELLLHKRFQGLEITFPVELLTHLPSLFREIPRVPMGWRAGKSENKCLVLHYFSCAAHCAIKEFFDLQRLLEMHGAWAMKSISRSVSAERKTHTNMRPRLGKGAWGPKQNVHNIPWMSIVLHFQ